MSEWVAYVEARLRLAGVSPERAAEIVEDVARQLEDAYAEALGHGEPESDARAAARGHVSDWAALARELEHAERSRRSGATESGPLLSAPRATVRRARLASILSDLRRDVVYGLRAHRQRPGVTVVALLTLALGIGANTAIFSVIDAVMLRALPVRDLDHLVLLQWTAKKSPGNHNSSTHGDCAEQKAPQAAGCSFSHPFVNEVASATTSFADVAAFAPVGQVSITGHGAASLAQALYVSGAYFDTLGVQPAMGRTLQRADETGSALPALVLSHGYWQRAFGGDPHIVGQTLSLNGVPFTVVGVADPRFTSLTPGYVFDLWLPMAMKPRLVERWDPAKDGADSWWIVIVARLKPGVSAAAAQAETSGLFRHDMLNGPTPFFHEADDPRIVLLPVQTALVGIRGSLFSQPIEILMAVVGAILLIACANIGGLLLARAAARQKEMAVRLSLGAGRGRLVRQALTESLTLAVLGGALAVLLATWTARVLVAMMSTMASGRDLGLNTALDLRVLAFATGLSLLAGLLFGIAPAWRGTQVEVTAALKDGAGRLGGRRAVSVGSVLVVTQVTLTVVVLMGAGLFVRTLENLRSVDAGFQTQHLLTFGIDLTLARSRATTAAQLSADLERELSAVPGVVAVSYSNDVLLSRSSYSTSFSRPGAAGSTKAEAEWLAVGPHFFETLGLAIRAGRDFRQEEYAPVQPASADRTGPEPATPVLVNESFVKTYLPTIYPIDQLFGASTRYGGGWQIVGVVSDSKYDDLRKDVVPTFYTALAGARYFEVRTAQDPTSVMSSIRAVAQRMDLPLFEMKTEAEQIDQLLFRERLVAQLSGFFGILALALASIGLYGLLSHEVSRRTREIGIRMALGAPRLRVLQLVVGQGVSLAVVGVGLGVVAGIGATRYLHSLLFGVGSGDPMTLAAVTSLLVCVSAAACVIPARRATRVDPLIALRNE
jgi:predicted permease